MSHDGILIARNKIKVTEWFYPTIFMSTLYRIDAITLWKSHRIGFLFILHKSLSQISPNIQRVFRFETTWKRLFPRRSNLEYTGCVCTDIRICNFISDSNHSATISKVMGYWRTKYSKNGPSKIFGKQSLKPLKRNGGTVSFKQTIPLQIF